MIPIPVSASLEALNAGLFVSPGFGTHPTRVLDSFEIIMVIQGALEMFEEDDFYRVERNQALILCPGLRHGGQYPYRRDVQFYWAHFRLLPPATAEESSDVAVPKLVTVTDPEWLIELFCRFISDQESHLLDSCSASHLIALIILAIAGETREAGHHLARNSSR